MRKAFIFIALVIIGQLAGAGEWYNSGGHRILVDVHSAKYWTDIVEQINEYKNYMNYVARLGDNAEEELSPEEWDEIDKKIYSFNYIGLADAVPINIEQIAKDMVAKYSTKYTADPNLYFIIRFYNSDYKIHLRYTCQYNIKSGYIFAVHRLNDDVYLMLH